MSNFRHSQGWLCARTTSQRIPPRQRNQLYRLFQCGSTELRGYCACSGSVLRIVSDISYRSIQKSGLEGSNKNAAYAGVPIWRNWSCAEFCAELIEYHIKVNAICPGNFFEGQHFGRIRKRGSLSIPKFGQSAWRQNNRM